MSDRLGTAKWEDPTTISQKYPYSPGTFWLGRAEDGGAVGYRDDRHICLVSGTRGGKGASVIVNNLCVWPGSAVVVDPKGENATVTAARRGKGSEYCDGMGQAVHVLDPFKAAQVDDSYRSSFNPLDALDPDNEETRDEANRIASAIIVVRENAAEPFWDEAARDLLRGLILYVLTAKHFMADERNLITVRNLILRGEWQIHEAIRGDGHDEEKIDPPHLLLWRSMERSTAFDGLVSGLGARFRGTMKSEKMYEGILQAAVVNTEFLDSPGMRRVLCSSSFELSELKTRPEGMTMYLSLPQRYMETHYRWLRMMVALTINEMEIHPGRPATGHPILMVLDEFAGLKRMAMIENAVAQLAGFGVKLFYVLQSLEQLKGIYKDHWETFVANAGIKMFFSVGDPFTQKYVSTMAGETEVIRELQSVSESQADNESYAEGRSESYSTSRSSSSTTGTSDSRTDGLSRSRNQSQTEGTNSSHGTGRSEGESDSVGYHFGFFSKKRKYGGPRTEGWNTSTSENVSEGRSSSASFGTTDGTSRSNTRGTSESFTAGDSASETFGTSTTRSQGSSRTAGKSRGESVHRRPLIQPDEVGRFFTRIDDKDEPAYPGLGLVMVTGSDPVVVRRTHYFEDRQFVRCFAPHPDHKFLPLLPELTAGLDQAKFRTLLDDYRSGRTTLEQTQPLLRSELDELKKSQGSFCEGLPDDAWKKQVEWYCTYIRDHMLDVFTIARGAKSGVSYCTDLDQARMMDYVAGSAEIAKLLANPKTRPASIRDPRNLAAADYETLHNLVPSTKGGFPTLSHLFGREIAPFFAPSTWTPPPPPSPTQQIESPPKTGSSGLLVWIVRLIFAVVLAFGVAFGVGLLLDGSNTPTLTVYSASTIATIKTVAFWVFLIGFIGLFALFSKKR